MKNKRTIKVIETKDGSKSLFYEELNETYHSIHGAISESKHVFIKEGLEFVYSKKLPLSILEIGLGTGLNAMLTLEKSIKKNIKINYTTLEPFPLSIDIIDQLDYYKFFPDSLKKDLELIHNSKWNNPIHINNQFLFNKLKLGIELINFNNEFSLIYFDAFAPGKQSELWEPKVLENAFNALEKNGVLVTYCAKGQFRRNLQEIGFTVDRIPGPPGKREMIRATKN